MLNPFRPAPGSEPPALVGREAEIAAFAVSSRMTEGRGAAQPVITTGLRGMGKTVLLRRAIREAGPGAIILTAEGSENRSLGHGFRRSLERARSELTSMPERLKATIGSVIERLPKASFELPHDMGAIAFIDAIYELNESAGKHGRFLMIAIDEIQSADVRDLVPVVELVHETAGSPYPVLLIGAGLPPSKAHLHRVKTYSERWRYFQLGLLDANDTRDAFAIPLRERGIAIDDGALDVLAQESAGYPFFVQEYGTVAWSVACDDRITSAAVLAAVPGVRALLDSSLYDAAFEALTGPELRYAYALARLGRGRHRVAAVAKALSTSVEKINWVRNQLIKKEIVYSPATGMIEFRLPLTEQYLLRHAETLERRFDTT